MSCSFTSSHPTDPARRGSRALIGMLCLLPLACAHKPPAPIEDREQGGIARGEERYVVLPADTLFSIAFRHGLDYRRLAAANGIAAPYTIFPGQVLRLAEAAPPRPSPGAGETVAVPAPRPPSPRTGAAGSAGTPTGTSAERAAAPVAATRATPDVNRDTPVSAWRWPATGRVTRGFDSVLHKGIDIAGERGDGVVAAAGGRVVYAGSGIAGYGLMLILRHNGEYLSAYGHNDALLVEEGDVVRAGQAIARLGSTGTDGDKLHFEIRRGGRPVDPRRLLPPR